MIKRVSIMLVVVKRGEELLKSEFVWGWLIIVVQCHVSSVVDKISLEVKIY